MSKKKRSKEPSRREDAELDETSLLAKAVRLLEILVGLQVQAAKGGRTQAEMITLLDSAGCGRKEIAGLLGTTANTVNVTLHRAKRKAKKK
ncbi:MAG TPA: sigma factor-like helix-turn-helix DNA-binding protein [Candidatus Udaeobacter sp.]|nr:sigma factor-like helix-turn-helix DNA-binding protein [Candidatus Udaeobacter sp.]